MRRVGALATVALATVALLACGESQPGAPNAGGAGELTVASIRARALDALSAGDVFSTKATTEQAAGSFVEETWIDLKAQQARVEQGGVVARIFSDGKLAELHDARYVESPYESSDAAGPLIAFTLPHIALLPGESAQDVQIDAPTFDGQPAIRVRYTHRYGGDLPGDESVAIYLDQSFLPLRIERKGPDSRALTTAFQNQFVARDALPADFFSFDAVRQLALTPEDDIRSAVAAGLDVFWLGSSFEGMVLRDESRLGRSSDEPQIWLSYGPADPMVPSPCVRIEYENEQRWSNFVAARGNKGLASVETIETAAGEFTIYAGRATPPRAVTPISEGPVPTPPPLPDAPEDTGVYYEATADTGSGGIVVLPNCGPIGTNRFRSLSGLELVLRSLRAY